MHLENSQEDFGKIFDLISVVNAGVFSSSDSKKVKLFTEHDIYHKSPQEVTILECSKKHKYSFIKRMKAKMELYEIYFENNDDAIKNSIISEIGNPNLFYRIFSSIVRE